MGVLANHVPSIEQLKPGLVEIIEESGGSKQFFRRCPHLAGDPTISLVSMESLAANPFGVQFLGVSPSSSPARNSVSTPWRGTPSKTSAQTYASRLAAKIIAH